MLAGEPLCIGWRMTRVRRRPVAGSPKPLPVRRRAELLSPMCGKHLNHRGDAISLAVAARLTIVTATATRRERATDNCFSTSTLPECRILLADGKRLFYFISARFLRRPNLRGEELTAERKMGSLDD